ncbi:RHS repeat-associated protein [Leeuwenhoekiella aestuarii]|nr:RHS repeat-associated protein [Leeuwenhoekiella aestuarii]
MVGVVDENTNFVDVKSNDPSNCYGDNFGHTSDDIWYEFQLNKTLELDLSHCGSNFDTYIQLFKNNKHIAYNGGDGPVCSGQAASLRITLDPGTYYLVSEGKFNNYGLITTNIRVNQASLPPPAPAVYDYYNFIKTFSPLDAFNGSETLNNKTPSEVRKEVNYYDGLGRPVQSVLVKATPAYRDIVNINFYDQYGREPTKYLPYAVTPTPSQSDGAFKPTALQDVLSFYENSQNSINQPSIPSSLFPYSENKFENSPFNRVLEVGFPGEDWQLGSDHTVKYDRIINTSQEILSFEVATGGGLLKPVYWEEGELIGTHTTDEHGIRTIEYRDKSLGLTYVKRKENKDNMSAGTQSASYWLDTYYIYNNRAELIYVLSPKFIGEYIGYNGENYASLPTTNPTSLLLDNLAYQYKYNGRGNLSEKKLPGKGKEYIVYNKLNQPCMTQDANLDAENKWLFTKYDAFGRVAYTGYWSGNETRANLQTVFDGAASQYETRTTASSTYSGDQVYYSNVAKPVGVAGVYTINYYDTYLPNGAQGKVTVPSQTSYGETITTNTKSLTTVSRVRVLTTNDWITTTTGYDDKGRVIWIRTVNDYLNTDDTVEMKLGFTGKVEESKMVHTKTGQPTITTIDKFTYDHMGRLTKQTQKINNQTEELIAFNEYDELGQLKNKNVGGASTGNGLQTVDYKYNIRGWLKTINDPTSLGNDLFAFKLNYNTADHGATPLFNGNISETEWRTANSDNALKWYSYDYDALNRITGATNINSNYNVSGINYDKNGNIKNLIRQGHTALNSAGEVTAYGTMDNLTYIYNDNNLGNKLVRVNDAGNSTYGFGNGANSNAEFAYDANGNLIKDLNKGIDNINYNHLNLPDAVNVTANRGAGTGTISYIYDATGIKLQKTAPGSVTQYAGNYIYKTENSTTVLDFFNHPEGYVDKMGTSYKYVYQYKDHLGNIRLSYSDSNGNGSINASTEILQERTYYPYGMVQKGYNSNIVGTENNYKTFQGQEVHKELGLNWVEFKYRNYDPTIGRFFSIDPLAEDYVYNGPYNFAENRVIDGIELEGLEWKSVKDDDGNTNLTLTVQLYNDAGLTDKQLTKLKTSITEQFIESFSNSDENISASLVTEDVAEAKGDFLVTLNEQASTPVKDKDGNVVGKKYRGGKAGALGKTQENSFEVTAKRDGSKRGNSDIARSFSHEAGHTAGLLHPWSTKQGVEDIRQGAEGVKAGTVIKNLMNSGANPVKANRSSSGTQTTSGQLKSIDKLIRGQQN